REQIHSNFIGQHVENGGAHVTQTLNQLDKFFEGHGASLAPARALAEVAALVQREATVLAYIDGFWLCFWFAIAALLVLGLMTRPPPGPFTPEPFGLAKAFLRKCGVEISASARR